MRGPISGAVSLSLAGKAAEMATLLVLATVVPRALGPDAYGRFSVALTIVTVGSLALTLGGPTTLARYVPAAPAHQRVALARRLGGRLARGRAVQLVVLAVVAAMLATGWPTQFPPVATALVVLALALNVAATLQLQMGLALGRTAPWSLRYPLQNAVLIAAVLALPDEDGAAAIVLAGAVAAALGAWVAWPLLRQPAAPAEIPAGALRFGVLQAAGAALQQVCHRGGVVVVAVVAGSTAEAGYAALATGIALGVTYAIVQAFTVSLPHLAGRAASPTGHDGGAPPDDVSATRTAALVAAEATGQRLAGTLLAALAPILLGVALGLDRLVPAVFDDEYADAVPAFGPALAAVALAPLGALVVQVSALRLRARASLVSGLAGFAVFVVVAAVAVPAFGAAGGTGAMLAAAAASAAAALVVLAGAAPAGLVAASYGTAAVVLAVAALA